jgi:hypothetical protein
MDDAIAMPDHERRRRPALPSVRIHPRRRTRRGVGHGLPWMWPVCPRRLDNVRAGRPGQTPVVAAGDDGISHGGRR